MSKLFRTLNEEEIDMVTEYLEALVALADAAEILHKEHYIIQPFFAIYKQHGGVIEQARQLLINIKE